MSSLAITILFFIDKIRIFAGGVGSVSTFGTGVTGWKLHQEANLTVEGVFNRVGYKTSPVKPSEEIHNPTTSRVFNWRAWDCVKRLFPGVTVNHELAIDDKKRKCRGRCHRNPEEYQR